ELPGDQAPAPKLRAQPPLLDQTPKERVALLSASRQISYLGRPTCARARAETLGVGHDLHPSSNTGRYRVELETDVGDLAGRPPEEGERRADVQPAQRFAEIEHIPRCDRLGLLHSGGPVAIERKGRVRGGWVGPGRQRGGGRRGCAP